MNTTQSNGWRWLGLLILLAILLILWALGLGPSFSGDKPGCCGVPTVSPPIPVQAPAPTQAPPSVAQAPAPEPVKSSAVNLGLKYENGKVALTGSVPTEADRQKLVTAASDIYGGGNVIDKLGVAANASLPGWWPQLMHVINNLKAIADYGLTQHGDAVTLTGAVTSEPEKTSKAAELAALLGANVTLDNRLTVKTPVAAPIANKPPEPTPPIAAKAPEAPEPSVACSADMNVSIHFGNNSSYLGEKGKAQLAQVVNCLTKPTVVIGHTDNYGEPDYNLQLSKARAKAVIAHIETTAPDKAKLLTATGLGENRPIATNANRKGRAVNRRIEFVAK